MKIFKSIYYYLRYGSLIINNSQQPKLDILLIYLKEVGIKSICHSGSGGDDYYYTITFNDNTTFRFWNTNRWYAWMSNGEINFSNGKKLNWANSMPSNEVLYKFKKIIKAHERQRKDSNSGFDDFLPIKLIRKQKLKKLNLTNDI